MKNRNVGYLIIGISIVIGAIIWIFNLGLKNIVGQTCTHGPACTMYDTIAIQTYTSLAIAGLILVIGLFFVLSKEEEKIIVKKIKEKVEVKRKPINYNMLSSDERRIAKVIEGENGAIFQSDIIDKVGFSKVKVSRLLDRLEAKQLIERKRRGMTNVVVLKQ